MKGVPLIRASALAPFVTFLEEVGLETDSLLASVGLPSTLSEPEALVPMHQACALLDSVARGEGLEHLGFIVGQRTPVKDALGGLGRLVAESFSLHEALHTLIRMFPAFGTAGRLRLAAEGGQMWLRHTLDRRIERGWREAEQFDVTLMVQIVRLASQRMWRPREVELRAQREIGLEKIEVLADARISLGHPSTGIAIPSELLREPIVEVKANLSSDRHKIERSLAVTAPPSDFVGSLRPIVRTLLRHGYPNVRKLAAAIGMSPRTFQRRLSEGRVSYSRLVDQERFRVAAELLAQPKFRITDVAVELGYQDLGNFTHAFQRWTGVAPSEYRRQEIRIPASRALNRP